MHGGGLGADQREVERPREGATDGGGAERGGGFGGDETHLAMLGSSEGWEDGGATATVTETVTETAAETAVVEEEAAAKAAAVAVAAAKTGEEGTMADCGNDSSSMLGASAVESGLVARGARLSVIRR